MGARSRNHPKRAPSPPNLGIWLRATPAAPGPGSSACHPVVVGLIHEVRARARCYGPAPPGRTMIQQDRPVLFSGRQTFHLAYPAAAPDTSPRPRRRIRAHPDHIGCPPSAAGGRRGQRECRVGARDQVLGLGGVGNVGGGVPETCRVHGDAAAVARGGKPEHRIAERNIPTADPEVLGAACACSLRLSWRKQDQTEWQIEWQMALVRASLRPADAGLCSCSGWPGALPAVTEPAGDPW